MNIRSNSHYEYPELIEKLISDLSYNESFESINIWCGVEIPYNFDNQSILEFLQDGLKVTNGDCIYYIYYDTITGLMVELWNLSMNYYVDMINGEVGLKEIIYDKKECEETNC